MWVQGLPPGYPGGISSSRRSASLFACHGGSMTSRAANPCRRRRSLGRAGSVAPSQTPRYSPATRTAHDADKRNFRGPMTAILMLLGTLIVTFWVSRALLAALRRTSLTAAQQLLVGHAASLLLIGLFVY